MDAYIIAYEENGEVHFLYTASVSIRNAELERIRRTGLHYGSIGVSGKHLEPFGSLTVLEEEKHNVE